MGNYDNLSRDLIRRMLEDAGAAGHVLRLEHREPPAGGHVKYWVRCSCGYESTARRSVAAALSTLAWHAGGVSGQVERNGGQPVPTRRVETPSPEHAGL